jgi:hypothetical protein
VAALLVSVLTRRDGAAATSALAAGRTDRGIALARSGTRSRKLTGWCCTFLTANLLDR